jgi:hypothetical protein
MEGPGVRPDREQHMIGRAKQQGDPHPLFGAAIFPVAANNHN